MLPSHAHSIMTLSSAPRSNFSTSLYTQVRKALGNNVLLLGPVALYLQGYYELPLPIVGKRSNTTGMFSLDVADDARTLFEAFGAGNG